LAGQRHHGYKTAESQSRNALRHFTFEVSTSKAVRSHRLTKLQWYCALGRDPDVRNPSQGAYCDEMGHRFR
jgi:hypothetical protein